MFASVARACTDDTLTTEMTKTKSFNIAFLRLLEVDDETAGGDDVVLRRVAHWHAEGRRIQCMEITDFGS